MKVVVIDGQGGKMGRMIIEQIKSAEIDCEIMAVGTNSAATSLMLKAGADQGATGENPVIVACRKADVIIGPIGIVIADALAGEITPKMAEAVGQSDARKLLIPVNLCNNVVVGVKQLPMSKLMEEAVEMLKALVANGNGKC